VARCKRKISLESRKILFLKNLAGGVSHQSLQNLEPLGLIRKNLQNKHLAVALPKANFAAWHPHDGLFRLWSTRSDVTTMDGLAVEIYRKPTAASVCRLRNFRRNRKAWECRRRWWRRGRLRALPSGDGLRQSGIRLLFSIPDAALEGPLFHGDVGLGNDARAWEKPGQKLKARGPWSPPLQTAQGWATRRDVSPIVAVAR